MAQGPAIPHRLCKNCVQFWKSATCLHFTAADLSRGEPGAPEMPQHLLHSNRYLEIKTGADDGCHFCSIIVGTCSGCTGRPALHNSSTGLHNESKRAKLEDPLYISIQILNESEGSFLLDLFACQQSQTFSHDQILNESPLRLLPQKEYTNVQGSAVFEGVNVSRLMKTTFSDTTSDLIRDWLHQCQSTHESCRLWLNTPGLEAARPRRLLDLNTPDGADHVKLIDNDAGIDRSYCALSYTWGISRTYLLTSSNLSSFQDGIKVSELPKTIQDVIEVTRRMGISYLWVDALCIMQDRTPEGTLDWKQQTGIMNLIFSGSILTIAASEAFGADEGFIQPRNPLCQTTLSLHLDVDQLRYDVVPPCTPHCVLHSFNNANYHLDSRSWVLQERLLSPRTAHFTKNFVHLECKSSFSCEGAHEYGSNCHHQGLSAKNTTDIFSFLGPGKLPDFLVDYFLSSWAGIIRKYSATNMSHPEDRLVALAGLASQLQGNFQLTPTFGLWKQYLLRGMLWYLRLGFGVFSGLGVLRPGRAPSWSWACLDINGPQILVETCLSVELVATILVMPETFAFDQFVPLHEDDSRYSVKISAPFKSGVPSNAPDPEASSSLAMRRSIRTHPTCTSFLHPQCPFHPDYDLSPDLRLYSVLIGRGGDGIRNDMLELGLVLTPVLGHPRQYRRVGYFHHSMRHQKDGPMHVPLASIFDGCEPQQVEII